jgi:hypothetical protein
MLRGRTLEELRHRHVVERRLAGNAGIVVLDPGPIVHAAPTYGVMHVA